MDTKATIAKVMSFVNNHPPTKRILGAILILLGGTLTANVSINPLGKDLTAETGLIAPLFATGLILYGIDVYHRIKAGNSVDNNQPDSTINN